MDVSSTRCGTEITQDRSSINEHESRTKVTMSHHHHERRRRNADKHTNMQLGRFTTSTPKWIKQPLRSYIYSFLLLEITHSNIKSPAPSHSTRPLPAYALSPLRTCNQFPPTGAFSPASFTNAAHSIPSLELTCCLYASGTLKPAGCSCSTNT
jgi:hypothetical protein